MTEHQLINIDQPTDIPPKYENTPIGDLLQYHNLGAEHRSYATADLLVGMCMDNRKSLNIPENFAFIIRSGGANLRYSEFKVAYAVAVGGVKHIALIGHTQCGMVNLIARKQQFIDGLEENAGWTTARAEQYFIDHSPMFEINNEIDFILSETRRLSEKYPKVTIAPLLYKVEDNRLYLIKDDQPED